MGASGTGTPKSKPISYITYRNVGRRPQMRFAGSKSIAKEVAAPSSSPAPAPTTASASAPAPAPAPPTPPVSLTPSDTGTLTKVEDTTNFKPGISYTYDVVKDGGKIEKVTVFKPYT